jgi:diguanylate cyclase (GGDEF)-like protein/PAS domain S-box-containing protein
VWLNRFFDDPDEKAWLQEHKPFSRLVVVASAILFMAYALVDDYIVPGALLHTWYWRLAGALLALSTVWSLSKDRITSWSLLHLTVASSSIMVIVNLIFLQELSAPMIALASLMQCFMVMAMLGPLRSLTWVGAVAALASFNVGLWLTSASLERFILLNFFIVFGISVLLAASHSAHRNYRNLRTLQSTARSLAHIVESSSDAIIGSDAKGFITTWNDGAQKLFGLTEQQARSQALGVLFSAESATLDAHRLQQALSGRQEESFQSKWCAADGRMCELSVRFSPILSDLGEVVGVSTIARDMSDERRILRELQDKDAQFRTAIETTHEGYLSIGIDGEILDVNNAYCQMSGFTRAELLAKALPELESEDSPEKIKAHVALILQHGANTFETQHRRADGSVWPVEVSTSYADIAGGRYFAFVKDLTERKRIEVLTWRQANYDVLTQLPNRALLFDRLDQECSRALRSSQPLALLFADLDGFKQVNDLHGHAAGDVVLQEVALRWLDCVRTVDTVARLGGDEFAVVLAGANSRDTAGNTAQKLIDALQAPFTLPDGAQASVGVSIGIAFFPVDAQDVDGLVLKADGAMYLSKRRGKNTWSHAS